MFSVNLLVDLLGAKEARPYTNKVYTTFCHASLNKRYQPKRCELSLNRFPDTLRKFTFFRIFSACKRQRLVLTSIFSFIPTAYWLGFIYRYFKANAYATACAILIKDRHYHIHYKLNGSLSNVSDCAITKVNY